ncbi:hypothetical protein HYT33_02615 [Candidatus Roizmanbacteria bacterium]|nr:hypothetical protein [Candidatus Roizmanbacteria bacterium]
MRLVVRDRLDQVPHLVRTLINGFHLIESDRLSGHPPTTTLLTGVKEVKTEFYHTAQTGQDEALVGLYVFDMSWKNQNNEENPFNQFVVELYANPNGQIIHGIKAFYNDKKESVQKIDMSAADFKRFPLLDRQRALVQGLITLFAPQPPKPQPR